MVQCEVANCLGGYSVDRWLPGTVENGGRGSEIMSFSSKTESQFAVTLPRNLK